MNCQLVKYNIVKIILNRLIIYNTSKEVYELAIDPHGSFYYPHSYVTLYIGWQYVENHILIVTMIPYTPMAVLHVLFVSLCCSDLAYSNGLIDLHTDNCYFVDPPGQ